MTLHQNNTAGITIYDQFRGQVIQDEMAAGNFTIITWNSALFSQTVGNLSTK